MADSTVPPSPRAGESGEAVQEGNACAGDSEDQPQGAKVLKLWRLDRASFLMGLISLDGRLMLDRVAAKG